MNVSKLPGTRFSNVVPVNPASDQRQSQITVVMQVVVIGRHDAAEHSLPYP